MTFNEQNEKKLRKNYKDACTRGHCPDFKERKSNRIRELADRLDTTSDKEVLTNVLEWEDKNIVFWFERYPLSLAITLASIPVFIFGYFSAIAYFTKTPLLVSFSSLLFNCFIASASVFTTLWLIAIYLIRSYRKLSIKQLLEIFPSNLSVDWILENKLCVCRDYAKLTACLLFKMRPEKEVYFVQAPSHVATGMMVNNKLYILDKWLPVVTLDKWHEKWHKNRFSKKTVEKAKGSHLETVDLNSLLSKTNSSTVDTDKLASELGKRLKIQSLIKDVEVVSFKIMQWKKGAILYEDDEIVNYSLARRLEMLISREMLDINHIMNLRINQRKHDLIFLLDLKS